MDYEPRRIARKPVIDAFYTSGCPECDRTFCNKNPIGPVYNITSRRAPEMYIINFVKSYL